jgi:pyridoxamine 5'-phosphate oxidase
MPFKQMQEWIEKEKSLGSADPDRIVLATASRDAIPHSRIVAIREINDKSILFFTQGGTRKAKELNENPIASATLWLPLQQREVIMDGTVQALNPNENEYFWKSLSRERQLKFSAYAGTSGQAIDSIDILNDKYKSLSDQYPNGEIPMNVKLYCGYRLIPEVFYFYTLETESFSEIIKFSLGGNTWEQQLISP